MTIYLLNAPIITSYGRYLYRPCDVSEARALLANSAYVSAVGHEATAQIMSALLGYPVPVNRIAVRMEKGDVAVVFRILTRLPEGKILTVEELKNTPFEIGFLTREE
ncbi:MAG: YddF family protein [Hadesarchaea archaeon]|nr:YddF family protein [Hadesarchaea archaeon]